MFRQVIPALFVGLWGGAILTYGFSLEGLWFGFFDAFGTYIIQALIDSGHMSIILFSLLIGGLVGIISKNGGMMGIVQVVARFARSPKRGQISTAVLGTVIFFDDYANTMVVGNTMRAVTDKLKISREKLAYIVDSTAAPVASLALITTWIGFQVGLIDQSISSISAINESAYSIFLKSIPFAFYSIFAVGFVYLVAFTERDFGPMRSAERRVRGSEETEIEIEIVIPEGEKKPHASYAAIPLLALIVGTFVGVIVTGRDGSGTQSFQDIIGQGDPYLAMIWASSFAVMLAVVMTLLGRRMSLGETMDAFVEGMKSLLFAILVLTLAWSLAGVNDTLNTAGFLSQALAENLSPALLPLIVFLLSAIMAFATGSSWGVMGIVVPLAIPLTWAVISLDPSGDIPMHILYSSVAAVLSGAVWGDHCSPISDTTILSSMASGCDHIEHVRTQLPYAVVVAVVAISIGVLPSGYGISPLLLLPVGGILLWLILRFLGTTTAQ